MYGFTNFIHLDLNKALIHQPARIQFNTMKEWQQFKDKYYNVLSKRRDWYINTVTLRFIQ